MSKKITREHAIERLRDMLWAEDLEKYRKALRMGIKALEAPEIIRCKDCKYANMTSDGKYNKYKHGIAVYDHEFHAFDYTVGEWVYPNTFNDNYRNVCSNGIHFFLSINQALKYAMKLWYM